MELNKEQIEKVSTQLEKVISNKAKFFDEILDHYCSKIEGEMSISKHFDEAIAFIFNQQEVHNLAKIKQELHSISKKKDYSKVVVLTLLLIFLLSYFLFKNTNSLTPNTEVKASTTSPYIANIDTTLSWPVPSSTKISSGFGNRFHPVKKIEKFHRGIDIPAKKGETVVAAHNGIVIDIGFKSSSYGHYIIIENTGGMVTTYAQLDSISVHLGENVLMKQSIGTIGSSGNSTAPHLHFEVKRLNRSIDPESLLKV